MNLFQSEINTFQRQLKDDGVEKLELFDGNPRKLNSPFTKEEVMKSITKLNNNRSNGYDNISAELIKYGPDALHNSLPTIMNEAFEITQTSR